MYLRVRQPGEEVPSEGLSVSKILRSGRSAEKIRVLQTISSIDDMEVLGEIVSRLDDEDIQVRGEAFGLLVLNDGNITDFLVRGMESPSKNIRGFLALVLANRNEQSAIPEITKLACDESSMVRSCAIGALGHLKARDAADVFVRALEDASQEVRNSALFAVIGMNIPVSEDRMQAVLRDGDVETARIISRLRG